MDKETESQLHCSYSFGSSGSAFLRFQPVKKELVSLNPYIVMFHDVISDQDIESITQIAKPTVTIYYVQVIKTYYNTDFSKFYADGTSFNNKCFNWRRISKSTSSRWNNYFERWELLSSSTGKYVHYIISQKTHIQITMQILWVIFSQLCLMYIAISHVFLDFSPYGRHNRLCGVRCVQYIKLRRWRALFSTLRLYSSIISFNFYIEYSQYFIII